MIMLSRNTPVAFVVGAAGFVGSHLTEKLLEKGVQVVGLDDLSSGSKDNLEEVSKNKNFNFINQSAREKILLGFPRLDYAYFLISDEIGKSNYSEAFENFLEICKKYKSKIILLSSIDLYDLKKEGANNLREAEKKLAKFAEEFKLNARIVRISGIYGPKMRFRGDDPIERLIYASSASELQKEIAPLDFTTRCLFIADAVDLLIKAVMHGSTSQKIYDGALLYPIKVSEIRQILLDPLWHESRGFEPTELPPWPTPNLLKTQKELSWKPVTPVVVALRKTISFFVEHPNLLKESELPKEETCIKEDKTFSHSTLSDYRNNEENEKDDKNEGKAGESHKINKASFSQVKKRIWEKFTKFILTSFIVAIIIIGFIYPAISITSGAVTVRNALQNSAKAVETGDYDQADKEINQAKKGMELINETLDPYLALNRINFLNSGIESTKELLQVFNLTIEGAEYEALGIRSLNRVLRVTAGEEGNLKDILETSKFNLSEGDRKFALAGVKINNLISQGSVTNLFKGQLADLSLKIEKYHQIAALNNNLAAALPQLLAIDGQKNYLILLEDNSRLRPAGGIIDAYAGLSFKQGKIVEIISGQIDKLDKQIKEKVVPPAEIKKDTGSLIWQMKDVGFDPDFPTSAKWALWFYNQTNSTNTQAVITLDYSAIISLLDATGPIILPTTHEKIDSSNFLEKAKSGKNENFTAQVLKELLSKLFYVPKQNWSKIFGTTNQLFDEKHALFFAADAKLLSFINSQNWSGIMPRQPKELVGEKADFLAISEANMGNLGLNFGIKRSVDLQVSMDESGIFSHKLAINYSNEDESLESAGVYKNRLRIYLPAGTKLNKGSWGQQDITKDISAFTDYGRAGYSVLLNLQPQETRTLVLEYTDSKPSKLENSELKYSLDIVKQPGTDSSPLNIRFNYPSSFKAESLGDQKIPQEISFVSDLSIDRDFVINLQKK